MSITNKKGWQEDFARFFESPSREGLRALLQDHIGESNQCDFKKEWPAFPKLARHILGLANSRGGCLIVGVEETDDGSFNPLGIERNLDKAEIQKSTQRFIPAQLKFEFLDFAYEASEYPKLIGKKFQVVLVDDLPQYIPFVARSNGDGIRENAIYVRRSTNTDEAHYEELQDIFNRRIETGHSSREELDIGKHLDHLKVLTDHLERYGPYYHEDEVVIDEDGEVISFDTIVIELIAEKRKLIADMILRK